MEQNGVNEQELVRVAGGKMRCLYQIQQDRDWPMIIWDFVVQEWFEDGNIWWS